MKIRIFLAVISALLALCTSSARGGGGSIEGNFQRPPDSARPWVYWFWLNGNITKEGITADLEAMRREGIGGVLIMEVDQGAPVGQVDFMGTQWREMFKHAVKEAGRLGLEVNMNDDAGWNGSGGPWITPELSMQKVVWSETPVEGPKRFEGLLPQPETVARFYRDIAVFAVPAVATNRIENIQAKASYQVGGVAPSAEKFPPEAIVARGSIKDLTQKLDTSGRLVWDVPQGKWVLLRFGHTSTGVENAPAPASGRGLECDKLSKAGSEANFNGMMAKLISDVGAAAGRTLVTTHIDSWENGSQNWTARMREEFQARRGYDLTPFLPVFTGRVVESLEVSERFLWDLRQTVSDLVVENYAGHVRGLAQARGLKLSIEAYGGPCDDLPYAGRADEPMCEFWMGGGAFQTVKEMASAAHTYGKRILGAESFTADDSERWLQFPGSIKSLGDRAFCDGVNRFVFHRYAMQPWVNRQPGMTMGPWGLHYERTETWWTMTRPWHDYLARCQYLLRQGLFVADICYLQPETAPQSFLAHPPQTHDYDNCSADAVLTRMSVKNGELVLPDGMSYRVLVLPDSLVMTPRLLRKIQELVRSGATVIGPPPRKSPSLSGYPKCDQEVAALAGELWGPCDGKNVTQHSFGKGKVVFGLSAEKVLAQSATPPDFTSRVSFHYIHRRQGDLDVYFVANPFPEQVQTTCGFRVTGKQPELWSPETGSIQDAPAWHAENGSTSVSLDLGPSGLVFVVFRRHSNCRGGVLAVKRNATSILSSAEAASAGPDQRRFTIERASYGVLDDPKRTRDVRAKLQELLDTGERSFEVARMARGDDPAFGVVKTLVVDYTVDGRHLTARSTDPEMIDLNSPMGGERQVALRQDPKGRLLFEAFQPGRYEIRSGAGRSSAVDVPALPEPVEVSGPWELRFAPDSGAPSQITLAKLGSWSARSEPGVKYFSGLATYRKSVEVPARCLGQTRRLVLDLGRVEVMARVKWNGTDLGILWKPPYQVDITGKAHAGKNQLEVSVVNLWPNRMIGDEQLPEDSQRNDNGTLKEWPKWVGEGKPSPTGRLTFTSWRLWKKDSPLRESGLIGPVTLRTSYESSVKSE